LHGVEVSDPYRWLEDGRAPEACAWLSAQCECARPFLEIPHREKIRARLAELMKVDAIGFPIERQGTRLCVECSRKSCHSLASFS
jgi:prolyl oligopeptidase